MGEFGSKYSKISPTKDRGNDPLTKNKFNRNQENNDIVNHALDDIIPQEALRKKLKTIDSEINDNNLYQIDNISLDEKK